MKEENDGDLSLITLWKQGLIELVQENNTPIIKLTSTGKKAKNAILETFPDE